MRNLNSFLPRLNLDPGSEMGGGGSAGDLGGGEGGGAGAGASQDFVPRKDFEGVSSKLTQYERELSELKRWREQQSRQPQHPQGGRDAEAPEPKKPVLKDYDFAKDPEAVDRYNDDLFAWKLHNYEKSKAEKQKPQLEAQKRQESMRNAQANFNTLSSDYEKENPGFRARVASQGLPTTYDEVSEMMLDSKQAPALVDHFYKHPEDLAELNSIAVQGGERAAARYLGRLENKIESTKTTFNGNLEAAQTRPPRGKLGGVNGGGSATPSNEEIMKW